MAGISTMGVGSGIDIRSLVDGLLDAERKPTETRLNNQVALVQARVSAMGTLKASLNSFQVSARALGDFGAFSAMSVSVSDDDVLSASATGSAATGSYDLEVQQLARAQSLASAAYGDITSAVGTGTLTFRFGQVSTDATTGEVTGFSQNADKATRSIDITADNNTLSGVRDAVNAAELGVRASIINDGSGFRLVFDSTESGAENGFLVDAGDAAGGLDQLAFNEAGTGLEHTRVAADAVFSINGLTIERASNQVGDAISGVSFDLKQVGGPVRVQISQDLEEVKQAVTNFANAYNALQVEINNLAGVDESGQGGVLTGNAAVRNIMSSLRGLMGGTVGVLEGEAVRSLADVGITTRMDGTLELDTDTLDAALRDNFELVGAVFAPIGRPSDGNVEYLGKSTATEPGVYAVNITRAASRGQFDGAALASADLAVEPLVIDADNNGLRLKINGIDSDLIEIGQGSYTDGDALAAEMQARINGDVNLSAAMTRVTVQYDSANNRFNILSETYGSESKVEVALGNDTLGLSAGEGTTGVDVQGTINGRAAEGRGELLTSTEGASAGLRLRMRGTELGERGSVTFSQGLMESLKGRIDEFLETDGLLDSGAATLNLRLEDIDRQRERLERRLDSMESRLMEQFTAMDMLVAKIQSTGSFLTQQLESLSHINDR